MQRVLYAIVLLSLVSAPALARTFKYECVSERFKVIFYLQEDAKSYKIQYTILNTSLKDSLYCSPYCLIGRRGDSTAVTFDIGVLKYSNIVPDGFAQMLILAPKDSVFLESGYVGRSNIKKLDVSFNALALSALSKTQRKHFFRTTKWSVGNDGVQYRSIDLADYMGIYTDWFKMGIPICEK